MDLGLAGRIALVMGSSQGLGYACAAGLAREGAHVILTGRHRLSLEASCDAIRAEGGQASCHVVDFQYMKHLDDMKKEIADVDIVVTNCGGPPPGEAARIDVSDLEQYFTAMVRVPIATVEMYLPAMRQRKFGRIINIVSSGVLQPIANLSLSNTLRPALVGWAKTLSAEVAADGVTVNSVVPGRIHTRRVDSLNAAAAARQGRSVEEVSRASCEAIPMQRYGDPAEFADMVTFLASARASYVTGTLIRVDGGLVRSV
ncbi:SDR family oxidoreductase [Gluconacetobacter sp. 1b LMG 1731]|uniref:SDR family oxidoreductase n=1 Tax=Gluconacetobacter dulcium TaxID=2729096 RepID=A0A7W4IJ16_9PROT|nr:SDR family oxidoreductase [Gluconacetobacter dulcium]MBB2163803.1 SDR family oxidoreductase [Gluconacetobacter dulcium]MBB2193129.1 SDR family oxidoreductase [Gluconacetobacter dulcium]